ncbi:hypothetical protein UYO_1000 [Lachnospiraceae bacterium JC7]|nr:hypothetical protein UYO_1000 [Lachnospiraceae bacterium JC7]
MKRFASVTFILCLTIADLLSGCGKAAKETENKPVVNETTDDTANKPVGNESAEKTENKAVLYKSADIKEQTSLEKSEKTGEGEIRKEEKTADGRSLAQRMSGKYSYHYSGENGQEEFFIMDVVNFGDNVYAFCGQAMPYDYESFNSYTFWVSEFIPYDAGELKSTDGDKVKVNELKFSIMSNAGRYWDSGCTGTITLTDDGLVFEGFDHDGFLVPDYDDSRLFLKDDRVEDAFSYMKDDNASVDDKLQGYWVCDGKDADLYIHFSDSNMYLYKKSPDEEVFFAAGGCDFHDGSFDFNGNLIQNGGMPYEFSADYKFDGDNLVIESQSTDIPAQMANSGEFRRITDQDIHVTTMDEVVFNQDSFGPLGQIQRDSFYGVFIQAFKDEKSCDKTLSDLEDAGLTTCPVVYTPDFEGLSPEPYYAVTAGLYTTEQDAKEALEKVRAVGFKDAYVKYTGSYTGDRFWYYMYSENGIKLLNNSIILHDVNVTIPYITDGASVKKDLIVSEDTVFAEDAETDYFSEYEKGDTPYGWIMRNYKLYTDEPEKYGEKAPVLTGVFEVSLDGNKISSYHQSMWWD